MTESALATAPRSRARVVRLLAAALAVTLVLAGLSSAARHVLGLAARHELQAALDRARPHLLAVRATLVDQAPAGPAAVEVAGAEALEAYGILGAASQPPDLPGLLGRDFAAPRAGVERLSQSLGDLGQASQAELPRSAVLERATVMAERAGELELGPLRSLGLSLGFSPAGMERELRVAWLTAWARDLRRLDASAHEGVQAWTTWRRAQMPALIEQDQWQHLSDQATSDLRAVETWRHQFTLLVPPERAATTSSTYDQALEELESAYRALQDYLAGKAGVPRSLRLSNESLARYEALRGAALDSLDDLVPS